MVGTVKPLKLHGLGEIGLYGQTWINCYKKTILIIIKTNRIRWSHPTSLVPGLNLRSAWTTSSRSADLVLEHSM